MHMIPVQVLKKINSISALKVLVAFFTKREQKDNIVNMSLSQICNESGLAKNSVKKGICELMELGYVNKVEQSKYRLTINVPVSNIDPAVSKNDIPKSAISKIDTPKNPVIAGFKLSVGSKSDREQGTNIINKDINNNINNNYKYINPINHLDFKDIDFNIFYNKDINSLSLVNANMYLTEKELGALAKRVFDWSLPMLTLKGKKDGRWFGSQLSIIKNLLFRFRTEQVLATVLYYTTINPSANGLIGMGFLNYKGKVEKALDYFKSEYIENEHEYNKEELINRAVQAKETLLREEREKKLAIEKAREMQNMTQERGTEVANDIMADILGGIKIDFRR